MTYKNHETFVTIDGESRASKKSQNPFYSLSNMCFTCSRSRLHLLILLPFIHQHLWFPTMMAGGKYRNLVRPGTMTGPCSMKGWPWLEAKVDTFEPAFGSSFWATWSHRQLSTNTNMVLKTESQSVLSFCFTAVSQHCCSVCDMI